jgi:hypothetical protein
MEAQELRKRLEAARAAQERTKRASDGRLRRQIREAFARQSGGDEHRGRHLRVEPYPRRPDATDSDGASGAWTSGQ